MSVNDDSGKTMTPSRPYIVRAIYEWIVDNGLTPYLLVDALSDEVVVPERFVENDRIILNVSPVATQALTMSNDSIMFNARFAGSPMDVFIPVENVLAIYAQENGQGMMFEDGSDPTGGPKPPTTPDGGSSPATGGGAATPKAKARPSLKIVK
jgi:stringent starvation protein B